MNWEDEIGILKPDCSIDLYCNTQKKLCKEGGKERQNSRIQKSRFQFINYKAVMEPTGFVTVQ